MAAADIVINPRQFHANEAITLTVTPATGMDFSGVQSNGAAILPSNGITNVQAIPQSNGDLRIDFTSPGAPTGIYTLVIIGPDHLVMASGVIRCVPGL